MGKRTPPRANDQDQQPARAATDYLNIFAKKNRGLLLDIVVFVLNLFLMRSLTAISIDVFRRADEDNPLAKLILITTSIAMWVLPAAGAVLKRWHYHQRRKSGAAQSGLSGCLFNPILYFCLNLVVMSAIIAGLGTAVLGNALMDNGAVFVPLILLGLALTIVQTYLIYQYFSPPTKPPRWKFLRQPNSDLLGDICLFLNMILFQVAWNLLTFSPLGRVSGFEEFCGRLFFLCFIALLIYFPPRMFYLAEDITRRRTWFTMLLANSPVIIRVLIGTGSSSAMW